MNEIKENVLHWLEKEESAFDSVNNLWRDKIDTTGAITVKELFERYEKERGPLSTDDLKDLQSLPFGNSVASALEESSSKAATAGAQSSPSMAMVTRLDRLRVPSKPSSNDWFPEKTQNIREENEQLKIQVHQLEEALERERAENIHCKRQVRYLQQEVVAKDHESPIQDGVMHVFRDQLRELQKTVEEEKLARKKLEERYDEKCQELEKQIRERRLLVALVGNLKKQLELERSFREQDRAEFQRQLQLDREEFQRQLQQDRGEYRQQLQQDRGEYQRQLQQDRGEYQRQLQLDRGEFQRRLQHVERVAEEHCARHQQPETRTWIIQRNEVVPSNKVLGEGSWGIVREGTFRGSTVAIKELHIQSPDNRILFKREMEISSRCRHPNIVQLIGATSDDQHPLIVTELLDGNLKQLLDQRPLSRGEIISLALDVARGLNFMHHSHPPIVHRDVKSDNVLLKERGDKSWIAKLSDFGTANFLRRVMTPNQGTPLYSAPESSTAQHSELVDVYSFGLLVLEMCIRENPEPDQLANQIKRVACPRLQELICCCVEQAPEKRPGMDAVIEFLTKLME